MNKILKISYAIASICTFCLLIISVVFGYILVAIVAGVFTICLSIFYKKIFKNPKSNRIFGDSELVYDRETDGELNE